MGWDGGPDTTLMGVLAFFAYAVLAFVAVVVFWTVRLALQDRGASLLVARAIAWPLSLAIWQGAIAAAYGLGWSVSGSALSVLTWNGVLFVVLSLLNRGDFGGTSTPGDTSTLAP